MIDTTEPCRGCKTGYWSACSYCRDNRFFPDEILMNSGTWEWLVRSLPAEWLAWSPPRDGDAPEESK